MNLGIRWMNRENKSSQISKTSKKFKSTILSKEMMKNSIESLNSSEASKKRT